MCGIQPKRSYSFLWQEPVNLEEKVKEQAEEILKLRYSIMFCFMIIGL